MSFARVVSAALVLQRGQIGPRRRSFASMARGEIMIRARDGQPVPETAGIGPNGEAGIEIPQSLHQSILELM